MTDLHHFYSARKDEFILKCKTLKASINRIAIVRIILALLFFFLGYLAFSNNIYWYFLIPVGLLFIYFVSQHSKKQEQYDLNRCLVKLNELEIEALSNNYSSFGDGKSYSNPHHAYSYDLDLFGAGSVFQYINRCGTVVGEDRLAIDLMESQPSVDAILGRQKAIEELSHTFDLRQWFWAQGHLLQDDRRENQSLFAWLLEPDVVFKNTLLKSLLIIFPIISLGLIGLTIYNTSYFPLLFLFAGIQWIVISFKSKDVTKAEVALSHHKKLFEQYAKLLQRISQEDFKCHLLISIQEEARDAGERIKLFAQLVNAFETRKNAIANMFGNSLYLYDLQCLYKLEKWRSMNHSMVKGWIDKIAEIDSLISFSTFHFNNQSNAFPEIHNQLFIQSQEMGHPLLDYKERVNNTFELGQPENIMLITGANMAGKSTFLRATGVNVVLALAGSSVCARSFSCPMIALQTSMRATDSLVEHQSYFYAELSRLKNIMGYVKTNRPTLVLLDEILRGTNSNDKHEGSIGLIKQFVSFNALVMLASHDVALGELSQQFPRAIRNFCFESEIKDDSLSFDYTLHPGVAHKANATFLMQKMDILPPSMNN